MAKRKLAPLTEGFSVHVTEREMAQIDRYCAEHDLTRSEYVRTLLRIHLGFANDLQIVYKIKPKATHNIE